MTSQEHAAHAAQKEPRLEPWNPWMVTIWITATMAILIGLIATNYGFGENPNPAWALIGQAILIGGFVLLAGVLALGATNWQARR
jgi:hypothetical protein